MTTVRMIYDYLNGYAPFAAMPEWDNSGLLVGSLSADVRRVALCLDATSETIAEAEKQGAELMVSHHPILYTPVQRIDAASPEYRLIRAGIALISLHIPLDNLPDGPNRVLCEKLGLSPAALLNERRVDDRILCDAVIGEIISPMTSAALAKQAAQSLGTAVRFSDSGRPIHRVAVCGGSGGHLIADAAAAGCDALMTGELKHHEMLEAQAAGLAVILGGHFATEIHIPQMLLQKLQPAFPEVSFFICKQTDPCGFDQSN